MLHNLPFPILYLSISTLPSLLFSLSSNLHTVTRSRIQSRNPLDYYYTVLNPSCNPLSKGLYRGALPSPVKGGGVAPPPLNSELSNFSNLKLKSEEHNKLVCCTFSALRRLYIWTRASMTEGRIKYLSRIIHRMSDIRDSEVKQLFLNAKPRRLKFGLEVVKDHFCFVFLIWI